MSNLSSSHMEFDSEGATRVELPENIARLFETFENAAADPKKLEPGVERPWDYIGPALNKDQAILLEESGYKMENNALAVNGHGDSEKEQSEKRKKERALIIAEKFSINGVSLTVNEIIDRLTVQSQNLQKMMMAGDEYFSREPTPDDLLRVKDGKIISAAQDPNGQYVVTTSAQKAAFEEENGVCVLKFSADEIGTDALGKDFIIPYAEQKDRMAASIAEIDKTKQDLKSGEITPDQLPENMKNLIAPEPTPEAPAPQAPVLQASLAPLIPSSF